MRRRALPILLLVLTAPSLGAQSRVPEPSGQIPGPQPSVLWSVRRVVPTDTVRIRRGSHWQTGALVGGLAGSAFGFAVMRSVCAVAETDAACEAGNTILGSLMFGAAGATVGAIVGGLFPRY